MSERQRIIDGLEYVVDHNDTGRPGWVIYVGNEGDTTGHVYDTEDDAIAALDRKADRAAAAQPDLDQSTPPERLAAAAAMFETAAAADNLDWSFIDDLRDTLGVGADMPQSVVEATTRRKVLEDALRQARDQERAAIRAALDDGVTGYAIAQATGMSSTAVYKIRDGKM